MEDYAPNAVVEDPLFAAPIVGKEAIAALFRTALAQRKGKTLRVKVTSLRLLRPDLAMLDGTTELKVEFEGQTVTVPVTVKDAKADRPISFRRDVMPVFMRAGCNQGGCHGAARGKDGFRLSLFGFDPDGDPDAWPDWTSLPDDIKAEVRERLQ